MSTSSSATAQDDSSSASTDSSHTIQPSPPQESPNVSPHEESDEEEMLLADEEDVMHTPASEYFDEPSADEIIEEFGLEDEESGDELNDFEDGLHECVFPDEIEEVDVEISRSVKLNVESEDEEDESGVEYEGELQELSEEELQEFYENEAEDYEEEQSDDDNDDDDGQESDDDTSTDSEFEEDNVNGPADSFAFSDFADFAARKNKEQRDAWKKFYPDDSSDDSADEEMTIERIEDILFLAECRLKDQEKTLQRFARSAPDASVHDKTAESRLPKPYMKSSDKIVRPDAKALVNPKMRALANKPRVITEVVPTKQSSKKKEPPAGLSTHFGLPRTNLTPQLKRDLQLLSMRAVLDPKRMYKRQGKFKIPEYSQVGTIVEGPTDFFGGRLNRKERRQTFVGEVLEKEKESGGRFKRKYDELQVKKRSGKKGSWKERVQKRRKM